MLVIRHELGLSLIELAVALAVLSILLAGAYPSYTEWISNLQVRTTAERIADGLNTARMEAMKNNSMLRFSIVTDLSSSCALSNRGRFAVVSQNDPAGQCNTAISAGAPFITHVFALAEQAGNVALNANDGAGTARSSVTFDGLGRVTAAAGRISRIDVTRPGAGRPLSITISAGGRVRLCDPSVTAAGDPRLCVEN